MHLHHFDLSAEKRTLAGTVQVEEGKPEMKTKLLPLLALSLFITGCATVVAVAPGSENVRITANSKDVVGCKVVGPASIPLARNELGLNVVKTDNIQIVKNHTFAVGGDTFFPTFSTKRRGAMMAQEHGTIYNCSGVDTRQPVPTQQSAPATK